ncbi:hypothetical protein HAZT_HAZT001214 [Hyalella azteca]|uniref:Uncharacterized protein n=1 Tax=Hyalella azteca TaxID=294128 RepID=A0A6A0HBK5_HYAAZ|nr:hypothetical protein HAZT_HAZT001214 [Hyalella azteca]
MTITYEEFSMYLWTVMSGMYGKLVVLLMFAFCLTEVLENDVAPLTFQGIFLIYLYVGSIFAIICIYTSVIMENCPSMSASKENLTKQGDPEVGSINSFGTLKRAHISRSKTSRTSFYLRIGALVFGLVTLIFNGLEIAMHSTMRDDCAQDVMFAHPIMQALFTFLQMHFLFVNSEVVVEKFGQIARFAFMHLVATNLAIWVRMVVWESANDWIRLNYGSSDLYDMPWHAQKVLHLHTCYHNNTLGRLWTGSQQQFFPFLIEYRIFIAATVTYIIKCYLFVDSLIPAAVTYIIKCYLSVDSLIAAAVTLIAAAVTYIIKCYLSVDSLIAAAVTYIMWRNVGKEHIKSFSNLSKAILEETLHEKRGRKGHWKVDCRSASKGLFLGLLVLVGGIVILIIFFVMKDHDGFDEKMFWMVNGSQIIILSLSILSCLIGFWQIPKLAVSSTKPLELDRLLLSCTIVGVYIFAIFGMIVGGLYIDEQKLMTIFCSCCLLVIQVSLQGMLVAEASRRTCSTRLQQLVKPGRQVITFLLFSNITLWILDSFITHSTLSQQFQIGFYGTLAWGSENQIVNDLFDARDMTESSEVVHELLEIVHTETELEQRRTDILGKSSSDEPGTSECSQKRSERLKAVVQNWKREEAYAFSSKDSWSLKKFNDLHSSIVVQTNTPKIIGWSTDAKPDSSDTFMTTDDLRYFTQVPIRQRLRESWKNQGLKNNYIRKLNPDDNFAASGSRYITDGKQDSGGPEEYLRITRPVHLLPLPRDLVLLPRKDGGVFVDEDL